MSEHITPEQIAQEERAWEEALSSPESLDFLKALSEDIADIDLEDLPEL